jgi:hypothetical protein
LEDRERDSTLKPNEDWDDSVVALLNYPEVIELMNDDLDWTYDLGTAVLNQRADVLNAIQEFRDEAYAAGNLRSDERQTVVRADDAIEIKPANPQVIYVPYYEPERVVIYQPAPVYYYYPRPYPVYYYPYPAGYRFSTGFFWGVNSWFSIGWHSHRVHVYDPFYHGHPYYGRSYYNPFFVRNVYVNVNHYHRYPDYVWQPRYRYGGRPVVRGSEGRVYAADRTQRRVDSNGALTRTREGSAYRANGTPTTAARSTATRAQQPRSGASGSAYRERSAGATQRATQAAQASRAPQVAPRDPNGSAEAAPAYRRDPTRATPSTSPRALQRSTGMPREATRVAPAARAPAQAAPATRAAPVDRGGMGAQRSESGGSYRGNSGGGNGGANRGGGSQRAAPSGARGSEGRSAAR